MVSFVIPNVFADTLSDSYDAVAINAVSPVAPVIRTTVPFVMLCPVVFFTYINMSAAFCAETENDADITLFAPHGPIIFDPVINDAVVALDADTANEADVILFEPNGPNTFDPVTNDEVLANEAVPCNDPVMLGAFRDASSALEPEMMTFFQDGIFIILLRCG